MRHDSSRSEGIAMEGKHPGFSVVHEGSVGPWGRTGKERKSGNPRICGKNTVQGEESGYLRVSERQGASGRERRYLLVSGKQEVPGGGSRQPPESGTVAGMFGQEIPYVPVRGGNIQGSGHGPGTALFSMISRRLPGGRD